jgi:hypothetical protein
VVIEFDNDNGWALPDLFQRASEGEIFEDKSFFPSRAESLKNHLLGMHYFLKRYLRLFRMVTHLGCFALVAHDDSGKRIR